MKKIFYVKGRLLGWNNGTFGLLNENKSRLNVELQGINAKVKEEEGRVKELTRSFGRDREDSES